MIHLKKIACFFFVHALVISAFAQDEQEMKAIVPSRFQFKANVAIPSLVGNKAIRASFRGVYEGTANLQVRLFNGVYMGAYGSYTGFKISPEKIANLNSECRTAGAGLNLGYEKFSMPRVMWYVNFASGYNWINYFRVQCPDSIAPELHHLAWSYRPSAGFCYYSDDNFSLGLSVAYTFLMNEFDPTSICLDKFKAYRPDDSKGYTNYFSIGVTLNFNLRKDMFNGNGSSESDGEEDN